MKLITIILALITCLLIVGCSNTTITENTPEIAPAGDSISGKTTFDIGASISHSTSIVGKAGFEPMKTTINLGDSISFTNNDPQKRSTVLSMKRDQERKYVNSPLLKSEETWEYFFNIKGEYTIWTAAYGVMGKVVVE